MHPQLGTGSSLSSRRPVPLKQGNLHLSQFEPPASQVGCRAQPRPFPKIPVPAASITHRPACPPQGRQHPSSLAGGAAISATVSTTTKTQNAVAPEKSHPTGVHTQRRSAPGRTLNASQLTRPSHLISAVQNCRNGCYSSSPRTRR